MSDIIEHIKTFERPGAQEPLWGRMFPFLYCFLAWLFLSVCHLQATHRFSFGAYCVLLLLCSVCLTYGRLFVRLAKLSFTGDGCLSVQFLIGYLVLNTTAFGVFCITPFTLRTIFWVLALFAIGSAIFCRGFFLPARKSRLNIPDLLCLIVSGAGAILWCSDSLRPPETDGNVTVYRLWLDGFVHVREISSIGHAHGLHALNDIRMSGAPDRAYHIASYIVPAILFSTTGTTAFDVFTSFQLPVGILLTGFAAFSLIASFWGVWPGLSATAGVVLLPDAYEQGFGCKFLSYEFLQQAGPGGLYGVACAAVAWLFVVLGCRDNKISAVMMGWVVLLVCVTYKAHLFVANAFVLMIYPCIFFQGISGKLRLVAAMGLTVLFLAVINVAQANPSIPTLRLDGSGARDYSLMLLQTYDPGFLRSTFDAALAQHDHPQLIHDLYLSGMILAATFGLWTFACLLAVVTLRSKIGAIILCFPLVVIGNYLIMSVGLALDQNNVGTREELLHRPFVWAYFAVAVWTSGAVYKALFGDNAPASRRARILMAAVCAGCFTVPMRFAHNLQTMPIWPDFAEFKRFNAVPTGLVKATRFIREHSATDEIVQDSENDLELAIGALTERRDFAVDHIFSKVRSPLGLRERLVELAAFKEMTDATRVVKYAKAHNISWYILQPASKVAWPEQFVNTSVYKADGYRLFYFGEL